MKKCNCGCGEYVNAEKRFWQKVVKRDSCWIWGAAKDKDGYGRFSVGRKTIFAHRFSYQLHVSEIQPELVVDHICKVRSCVKPSHLRVVTKAQNTLLNSDGAAAKNARKNKCKHGHELNGKNLYVQRKTGKRYCRECDRTRGREYYKRKNAASK